LPIGSPIGGSGVFSVPLPLTTDFTYVPGLPFALGPGTHLLQFLDFSNVFAGGTAGPHIVEESLATFAYTIHGTVGGDVRIPEPPTIALLAIGFLLAGLAVRRSRLS
jgi:hypothetical protein